MLEFAGAIVLVSHDRYLLDRVSTMVIGLDGGNGGIFADYSQWEASRSEQPPPRSMAKEQRLPVLEEGPKRKLAYLEQREWDGMEAKILEAERELAARHRELQEAASDARRSSYEELQRAQRCGAVSDGQKGDTSIEVRTGTFLKRLDKEANGY
jgi:ATP-binding cassette subfamily F protein uup